ncbi:hypothetical protein F5Y17DRAFT_123892 [Xylariaceae sp. FL0594]|nr:hypothetical protein F5Y17DRAFT_123892 [Xylariaceae sp. FL0594]
MMNRTSVARLARMVNRGFATRTLARVNAAPLAPSKSRLPSLRPAFQRASLSSTSLSRDLTPEELKAATPGPLTDAQYHELADDYLDRLLEEYERLQETRTDLDVEYSSGVMNITICDLGTYVINKQPPNRQIWLSSPTSGPKRFDWVVIRENQDQKQETAKADWIYLRDGSSLTEILRQETGISMAEEGSTAREL